MQMFIIFAKGDEKKTTSVHFEISQNLWNFMNICEIEAHSLFEN